MLKNQNAIKKILILTLITNLIRESLMIEVPISGQNVTEIPDQRTKYVVMTDLQAKPSLRNKLSGKKKGIFSFYSSDNSG